MKKALLSLVFFTLLSFNNVARAEENPECASFRAGRSESVKYPLSAFASAHAEVRFFGAASHYSVVDQALAETLQNQKLTESEIDLSQYAEILKPLGVCWHLPRSEKLTAGVLRVHHEIAYLKPGIHSIQLPTGIKTVVLDLRSLPNSTLAEKTLEKVLAQVIHEKFTYASKRVRFHHGLATEVMHGDPGLFNQAEIFPGKTIEGKNSHDITLILVTEKTMAPFAVEIAETLRIQNKAWILGSDLVTATAESKWAPFGNHGLSYRYSDLIWNGQRFPDSFKADLTEEELPEILSGNRILRQNPIPQVLGTGSRSLIVTIPVLDEVQPPKFGIGDLRAALLVAVGTTIKFSGFIHEQENALHPRLIEVAQRLEKNPNLSRQEFKILLQRLGESLADGHNFVFDWKPSPAVTGAGTLPVFIEQVDGRPTIRRSLVEGLNPGDTLLEIGNETVENWYAKVNQHVSASTEPYRFNVATRYLNQMSAPTRYKVKSPSGDIRTIELSPSPQSSLQALNSASPSIRPAGWLNDFGASHLYYINLSGEVLTKVEDYRAQIAEAQKADGLVLDLRGYPGVPEIPDRIFCNDFSSPIYRTPTWRGPFEFSMQEETVQQKSTSDGNRFCGRVVLLLNSGSVSYQEDLGMMFVDNHRVTTVGRTTAGTDGNMVGPNLPGAFGFTFSGVEVLHTDRKPLQGIGIIPDVMVPLTVSDLANGFDRDIAEAVRVLNR